MSQPIKVPASVPIVSPARVVLPVWLQFFTNIANMFTTAKTAVVPVAKLTGGGTNGSLTFTNGILTSYIDPT